jgi:hypothetical protein
MAATCRVCGVELANRRRQLCPNCWPVTRTVLATDRARRGADTIAACRRDGSDPTNTPEANAARAASLSARKREQLAWDSTNHDGVEIDLDRLPDLLVGVPLRRIHEATGLSLAACSRIRSGSLSPHRRHWLALHALAQDSGT